MTPNGSMIFLLVVTVTWLLMMLTIAKPYLCRQAFSGVWSSIVIDDCSGSYWTPTGSQLGSDGRLVRRNTELYVSVAGGQHG